MRSWLSRSLSPLQGKEEFEKTQKELLEKGNIMRQGKGQLELQQVRTRDTRCVSKSFLPVGSQPVELSPGPSQQPPSTAPAPCVCWVRTSRVMVVDMLERPHRNV